jgi:hypothetical protein
MDAHAHLLSLGWAGTGHALDSKPYKQKGHRGLAYDPAKVGNTGHGLVKPLTISKRQERLGIGKKAHEPQAGNEWWLKGFESALGNIGKSESERSSGASTPVVTGHSGKHGSLYSFFVRGQEMQGTFRESQAVDRSSRKRKSDVLDEQEEPVSKQSKKQAEDTASIFEQAGAFFALRDKDEKRRHLAERPNPVDEFEGVGQFLAARSERREKKDRKRRKTADVEFAVKNEAAPSMDAESEIRTGETKEERRERRRRRREARELRQREAETTEHQLVGERSSKVDRADDAALQAARRAERKRRKAERSAVLQAS